MALRAVFIGINKYRDPRIHELTGATRDATALWALFKDSVEGIAAKRLLDDEATTEAIRKSLDSALGEAAQNDTVIVFFAGHGTPGHQLVPFDADLNTVDQTTIPMQELADRLKRTAARASWSFSTVVSAAVPQLVLSRSYPLCVVERLALPILAVPVESCLQQLRMIRRPLNSDSMASLPRPCCA